MRMQPAVGELRNDWPSRHERTRGKLELRHGHLNRAWANFVCAAGPNDVHELLLSRVQAGDSELQSKITIQDRNQRFQGGLLLGRAKGPRQP
jgi:hypothetical protein